MTRPINVGRAAVALLIALLALVAIFGLSLRPQTLEETRGRATIHITVDRSAVLLPGTCVNAAWQMREIAEVYLNGEGKTGEYAQPICIGDDAHGSPDWRVRLQTGIEETFHIHIGVLVFRADFWILVGVVALALASIVSVLPLPLLSPAAEFMLRGVHHLYTALFRSNDAVTHWLKFTFAAINAIFCLSFLALAVEEGIFPGAAYAALCFGLIGFTFSTTATRLFVQGIRRFYFPFLLVILFAFVTPLIDLGELPTRPRLFEEITIWTATLFLYLFFAWIALWLHALVRRRSQSSPEDLTGRERGFARIRLIGLLVFCGLLLAVWLYTNVLHTADLHTQNYSWDSEPAYFFTGLALFDGKPYGYIQHPSTGAGILSSLVFALTYPVSRAYADSFILFHLQHPRLFIVTAHAFTTILSCVCVLVVGLTLIPRPRSWSDVLVSIAVPASFFAIHPDSLMIATLWSHHAFSFPLAALLLYGVFLLVRANRPPRLREWIAAAVGAGLLTSIQYYFAPWMVGVVVTVTIWSFLRQRSSFRRGLFVSGITALASFAGFLAGTAIIAPNYDLMLGYAQSLVFHVGHYGSGAAGIVSPEIVSANVNILLNSIPFVFVCLGICGVVILLVLLRSPGSRSLRTRWIAFGIGLFAQTGASLFLLSKHLTVYYALSLVAVNVAWVAFAFTLLPPHQPVLRAVRGIGAALLIAGMLLTGTRFLEQHQGTVETIRQSQATATRFLNSYADSTGQDVTALKVLTAYASYDECYFLWFGDLWAMYPFTEKVARLCPNTADLEVTGNAPRGSSFENTDWDAALYSRSSLGIAGSSLDFEAIGEIYAENEYMLLVVNQR